ncbi:TetR family transcriptional regulator [Lacticaseibacillus pantheris]|uniref:TetR family transcriptional regulator n=1 Tax=Lacticaseibacillus pantheris TaxID=171523 RepID=UPI0006D16F4E
MVLSTFNHIAVDKQTRVRNALLHEFVEHPLAEAQVARIVQEAEIARGAFYKYFTDLTDAYNYTFAFVMGAVHQASRNLRGVVRPTTTLSRFDASLMRLINRGFAIRGHVLPVRRGRGWC